MSSKKEIKQADITVSIAMKVAAAYGMSDEISDMVADGYTPYESLYEWDIVDEELIKSLIEETAKNMSLTLTEDIEELPF